MTKYCYDCKHAKKNWINWLLGRGYKYAKCTRAPSEVIAGSTDTVTGKVIKPKVKFYYCSTERWPWGEKKCGPDAQFWEAKRLDLNP